MLNPVTYCPGCGITTQHTIAGSEVEPVPVYHNTCLQDVERRADGERFWLPIGAPVPRGYEAR